MESKTTMTTCPCQENRALCVACVRRRLLPAHQARQRALQLREEAASNYRPATVVYEFEKLQDQAEQLRKKLRKLQERQADLALRVARKNVELDDKRERVRMMMGGDQAVTRQATSREHMGAPDGKNENSRINTSTTIARERLIRLQDSVLPSLGEGIREAEHRAHLLRWSWALQALEIHRLDVQLPKVREYEQQQQRKEDADGASSTSTSTTMRQSHRRTARGIGKISGLVLPHAGPELFGVLPEMELTSALRLVASVTKLVAQCLGVPLPHPIWLQPPLASAATGKDETDIIHMASDVEQDSATNVTVQSQGNDLSGSLLVSASTASSALMGSILSQSKSMLRRAITATSSGSTAPAHPLIESLPNKSPSLSSKPLSMDPLLVQQRIRHAQAAILQDDPTTKLKSSDTTSTASPMRKGGSYYALTPQGTSSEDFGIAWQLLQHNVVSLCIRAGVPVDQLWPAEAVLLNLHALEQFGKRELLNAGNCEVQT
ncbi:hypothetical protein MPSEU_000530600 [Mayamaea pseudoterrestris]|nr:hypothetical protein MPSEU_000530600 [Mayamaea pseudoterrestris]